MSALGPRFGEEGSSSEVVDFQGVQSAIEAAEAFLEQGGGSSAAPGDEERVLVTPGDSGSDERGPGGGSLELPRKPMKALLYIGVTPLFFLWVLRDRSGCCISEISDGRPFDPRIEN